MMKRGQFVSITASRTVSESQVKLVFMRLHHPSFRQRREKMKGKKKPCLFSGSVAELHLSCLPEVVGGGGDAGLDALLAGLCELALLRGAPDGAGRVEVNGGVGGGYSHAW